MQPESVIGKYNNIKIVFPTKNTTLRLQSLDTAIIQSFKLKYRRSLCDKC